MCCLCFLAPIMFIGGLGIFLLGAFIFVFGMITGEGGVPVVIAGAIIAAIGMILLCLGRLIGAACGLNMAAYRIVGRQRRSPFQQWLDRFFPTFSPFPFRFPGFPGIPGGDWSSPFPCHGQGKACGCKDDSKPAPPKDPQEILKEALTYIRMGQKLLEEGQQSAEQSLREIEALLGQAPADASGKIEAARQDAKDLKSAFEDSLGAASAAAGAILSNFPRHNQ